MLGTIAGALGASTLASPTSLGLDVLFPVVYLGLRGSVSTVGSRVTTLRRVGGRPCLNLVNTVSWRGDATRLEDHLTDRSDCLAWCQRAGVITETEAHDLDRFDVQPPLLALRETLTAHLVDVDLPGCDPGLTQSATPCSTAPWSRSTTE